MFLYPSDEIVELKLGPRVKSFDPQPESEVLKVASIPGRRRVGYLILPALGLGLAAFIGVLASTRNAPAGLFAGISVLGVCFFGITKLQQAVWKSRKLGVFENGIRYAGDLLRFDEVQLLSFGAPKTVAERHLPTFQKVQRSVEKSAAARMRVLVENTRKLSLTPILSNGKQRLWLGIGAIYTKQQLAR